MFAHYRRVLAAGARRPATAPLRSTMPLLRAVLPLLLSPALGSTGSVEGSPGASDSLLELQFCQVYYDGVGDCPGLRKQVVANHTRALPTLELGDPSKPAMYFLHGWPDSAAEWSNQFEYFCAPPHGQYYCVAPTWFDFHPDVPARPADDLYWSTQVDAFHAVLVEMSLSDVTLVIHDFGSVLGYQLAWQYPSVFKRIISMDIGMGMLPKGFPPNPTPAVGSLMGYQQVNIEAFLTNNNTMMRENVRGDPCGDCASITAKTGWPYLNFVLNGTQSWQHRLAPSLPLDEWRLSLVPDLPASLPLLFLYGTCNIGTGCKGCPPCSKRSFYFFGLDWIEYLQGAGKPGGAAAGSKAVAVGGAGHWIQCRAAAQTNAAIASWLRTV
jgi:pimeloyl-ACP methyl ester carboxylesterase